MKAVWTKRCAGSTWDDESRVCLGEASHVRMTIMKVSGSVLEVLPKLLLIRDENSKESDYGSQANNDPIPKMTL